MSEIEKLDKNLAVRAADENGFVWYDCLEAPFRVYGLMQSESGFVRMPQQVADNVNANVSYLNTNTAGGRVRFSTDSPEISIRAKMYNLGKMPHFALTGSIGFDLYADGLHFGSFIPPFDITDGYSSTVNMKGSKMRDITINFPLYAGVSKLEIGLKSGSALGCGGEYINEKPVVFYGSSITQGGCASRPGNSYQAVVSRMLGIDYVNLGFSGGAKGEDVIADYVSNLSMSVLVYDYDYNAPTPEHLENTHAKMFKKVREKNPDLPIIMMTRPDPITTEINVKTRAIVMKTYLDALAAGDKNVYFLDGRSFVFGGDGTVDGCHPNDLGFHYMGQAVGNLLKTIL